MRGGGRGGPSEGEESAKHPEEPGPLLLSSEDKRPCLLGCERDRERSWHGHDVLLPENLPEFLIKRRRHRARPCGSHPQHPEWCLAPRMSDAYRKNSVPQLGTGVLRADQLVKSKGARNSIQNRPSFGSSSRVSACSLPVTEERRNAGGRLLPELRSISFAGSAWETLTEPTPSSPPRSKTASERRRV